MIVTVPNPVLTTPAKKVDKIDKKVLEIVDRMKRELTDARSPKGVGLAAPQIGIPLSIFIIKSKESSPIQVMINPQIISVSRQLAEIQREDDEDKRKVKEKKLEGCLSIPNVWGYLKRPKTVRLKYIDETGKIQERDFSGFEATIVQHETDHLNGILYTMRVMEQKQKLYEIEKDEKGEETLVAIDI